MIRENDGVREGDNVMHGKIADANLGQRAGPSLWARLTKHRPAVIDLVAVAILWQISTHYFSPAIVPPIQDIGDAIWKIFSQWDNLISLLATSLRVVAGLSISFALGATLGVAVLP